MKVHIAASYQATQEGTVELPEGVKPDDFTSMWVY